MRLLYLSLLGAVLFSATSYAQSPCGTSGLQVSITPANPKIGVPISVNLINSTTSTYYLSDTCTYNAVYSGSCAGPKVVAPACAMIPTSIPPGTTVSTSRPQIDDFGKQVPAGTYAFDITFFGPAGAESCCPTVTIIGPCPGPFDYGAGDAGSGGFVPALGSFGLPQVGNGAFLLDVTSGLGGAPAALFVSGAPASIGVSWGTLLVSPAPPFIQTFFPLGGSSGTPGAGQVTIPAPIPLDPTLAGASVYLQCVISDPGSIGGISHTQGKNVVICP